MPIERPIERRFIFNGSAVAFAGRIRRPDDVFVKAAAPSHIPTTGGLSEQKIAGPDIGAYHYHGFITFTSAHSRAHGDFSDPRRAAYFTHGNHGENELPANTNVEAQLDGLQVNADADPEDGTPQRVFSAESLHVHMESTSDRRHEVSFRSLSARFKGITLATGPNGTPVHLRVHSATDVFAEHDTKDKLVQAYAKDSDFRSKYAACFHPIGTNLPGMLGNFIGKHEMPHADSVIVATFVTGLEWVGEAPEGTELLNNRLTIHGLGRIYFGEIIIEEGYRRVTLLRFELGSKTGGDSSACEVVSNGTHYPPVGN